MKPHIHTASRLIKCSACCSYYQTEGVNLWTVYKAIKRAIRIVIHNADYSNVCKDCSKLFFIKLNSKEANKLNRLSLWGAVFSVGVLLIIIMLYTTHLQSKLKTAAMGLHEILEQPKNHYYVPSHGEYEHFTLVRSKMENVIQHPSGDTLHFTFLIRPKGKKAPRLGLTIRYNSSGYSDILPLKRFTSPFKTEVLLAAQIKLSYGGSISTELVEMEG